MSLRPTWSTEQVPGQLGIHNVVLLLWKRGHVVMKLGQERFITRGDWKNIVMNRDGQCTLYKCIQLSEKKSMFLKSTGLDLLVVPFSKPVLFTLCCSHCGPDSWRIVLTQVSGF